MLTRGVPWDGAFRKDLNKRCRVWFPADSAWVPGTIAHWTAAAPASVGDLPAPEDEVQARNGWYLIVYDGGAHEWTRLPDTTVVVGSGTGLPRQPKDAPAYVGALASRRRRTDANESRALVAAAASPRRPSAKPQGSKAQGPKAEDPKAQGPKAGHTSGDSSGDSGRGPRAREPSAKRHKRPKVGRLAKAPVSPPLSPEAAVEADLARKAELERQAELERNPPPIPPLPPGPVPDLPAHAIAKALGIGDGGERRSVRVRHVGDPADNPRLLHAMGHLERVWRGADIPVPEGGLLANCQGIEGLHVCRAILSPDEIRALRLVFDAHKCWAQYIYGSSPSTAPRPGAGVGLDSVLQRIDFGPAGCFPEGVIASQTPMWTIGAVRARLLHLLRERMRCVFRQFLPGADGGPEWRPDMLQLTQMRPNEELAPHVDSRDLYGEGIASFAWGQTGGADQAEGEPWRLCMRRGPGRRPEDRADLLMPPGSGYIITGRAQGRTAVCLSGKRAHQRCTCCWMHGVQTLADGMVTRQSITIRVNAKGRHAFGA
mmetsp:Transcript_21671/g.72893  ORF Transcript_21671/g.72893 Transcript_21671/m.72893 type:complete len:543 (-) Transcript_21671:533-2161(-)